MAIDKEDNLKLQEKQAAEKIEYNAQKHKYDLDSLEKWYFHQLTSEKEKTATALQQYNDMQEKVQKEMGYIENIQKNELAMVATNGAAMLSTEAEEVTKLVTLQHSEMKAHEVSCDELEIDVDDELDEIKIRGETLLYDEKSETRRLRAEEGLMMRKV